MTFDTQEIYRIWQKGRKVKGISPDIYRQDECGAWIAYNEYGNANSSLGWQIDFTNYDPYNNNESVKELKPLHCQNYRSRSDGKLVCKVSTNWEELRIS